MSLTWKPLSFSGHRPPELTIRKQGGAWAAVFAGNILDSGIEHTVVDSFLDEMKTIRFIMACRLDELGVTENIEEETTIEGL